MESFIYILEELLISFAKIIVIILEFIGISVICFGVARTVIYYFSDVTIKKKNHNIRISLGNSLTMGLEFKLGAEIINTVIINELSELYILAAIILLRAVLSFIIHQEMKHQIIDNSYH